MSCGRCCRSFRDSRNSETIFRRVAPVTRSMDGNPSQHPTRLLYLAQHTLRSRISCSFQLDAQLLAQTLHPTQLRSSIEAAAFPQSILQNVSKPRTHRPAPDQRMYTCAHIQTIFQGCFADSIPLLIWPQSTSRAQLACWIARLYGTVYSSIHQEGMILAANRVGNYRIRSSPEPYRFHRL
jgi:hypothetical protein